MAERSGSRPGRPSRRPTSHFNHFQTSCTVAVDNPPSYAHAAQQRTTRPADLEAPGDVLPSYTCTVNLEGTFALMLESINPLHGTSTTSMWRDVYVVLRGTLLCFYKLKAGGAGRLIRSYTLQHAEVGLATDIEYTVLAPQTTFARLVPQAARRRAWQREPQLFVEQKQHAVRLRAELEQLVLAHDSEEQAFALIRAIGAAIDISPPLDDRSIPNFSTVPRRRRRTPSSRERTDVSDPALIVQQERLLRDMYPEFAHARENEVHEPVTAVDDSGAVEAVEAVETLPIDEDELDLSEIRDDSDGPSIAPITTRSLRPTFSRQTTATSIISVMSSDLMLHQTASSPADFSRDTGKWQPCTARTAAQMQRYIRRCVPVLTGDAARASDIVMCHGRRRRINWRMALLEDWELEPPAYRAHAFPEQSRTGMTSASQRSSSDASREVGTNSASEPHTPTGVSHFELVASAIRLDADKIVSAVLPAKAMPPPPAALKTPSQRMPGNVDDGDEISSISSLIYCL